jgi:tRNA(adenine34) deaminase
MPATGYTVLLTKTEIKQLMVEAIEVAKGTSKTDVPIGAILVDSNKKIAAKSHNTTYKANVPIGHAEITAIMQTGATNLSEWTLITTLEPCLMCMGLIMQTRIKKLIFGAYDDKFGAISKFDILGHSNNNFGIEVIGGVEQEECSKLIRDYFLQLRQ